MSHVKIRILGPVGLLVDGQRVSLGGHRQREVLASLVARSGRPVPADVIIDDLWGENPPRTARNSIQRFVSDLRRALDSEAGRLETVDGGYLLHVDDQEVDGRLFEAVVERARQTDNLTEKLDTYSEALDLWTGRPFEGIDYQTIEPERNRLEALKADAEEGRAQALMELGRHVDAIPELEAMVTTEPLREQRWSMLMLALYRAGRQAEALRAFQKARAMLVEELGIEPSSELARLEEQILNQDPAIRQPLKGSDQRAENATNPYKGLEAFDPSDEAHFHGREDLTEEILESLDLPGITVVVGASGSGKSSVVMAGVVPPIKRDAHPGSSDWPIIIMHPGAHPLEELAKAAGATADPQPAAANEIDPEELVHRLNILAEGGDGLLLIIDQFEELFVLSSETVQKSFMDVLVRASRSARIVVTLRADFYEKPLMHREFAHLMADGLVTVMPLSPAELQRAITQPAASVGVSFEPALVAEMIDDVGDQPGALPLLQYALTEVFERRSEETIRVEDYDRVGGVTGALTARGEEIWRNLNDAQRRTARSLLLQLVAVSESGSIARRPLPLTHLDTVDDPDTANQVIDVLIENRLVSIDRKQHNEAPVLEVAHEALLREWTRLRAWVEDEKENLRTHRRLEAAAAEWELADRDPSFLLTGSRLERINEWQSESNLPLTPSQRAYVESSRLRREEEQILEQERRNRELALEQRSVRRLRLLVGVLALAIVVAAGLTTFALVQQNQAEERSAELSVRSLASTALAEFESNPDLSLLLAIEAAHISQEELSGITPIVEEALHLAMAVPQPETTIADGGTSLDISPDGLLAAVGRLDGSIEIVSTETLEPISTLEGHEDRVLRVAFDAQGTRIASASVDGTVRLWDVGSGLFLEALPHDRPVADIAWNDDGSLLLAGSGTSALTWDVATGELVDVVNLSTDGRDNVHVGWISDRIAVAVSAGPLVVWDVETGATLARSLQLVDPGTCALVVDSGHSLIHVGDLGGGIQSVGFQPTDGASFQLEPGNRFVAHDGPACALETGLDGVWAHSGVDGRVVLRDGTGEEVRSMIHGAEVSALAFDPESSTLTSIGTGSGGLTRVWRADEPAVGELDGFRIDRPIRLSVSVESDLVGANGFNRVVVRSLSNQDIVLDTDEIQAPGAISISTNGAIAIGVSESGLVEVTHPDGEFIELADLEFIAVVLSYNETGDRLLGADVEGNVALWDLEQESLLATYEAIASGGLSRPLVAASPVGDLFVAIEEGPTAVIRSLDTGEEMRRFPIEPTSFSTLSVDSNILAIGSETEDVALWDLDTGQQTVSLAQTAVTSMTMVPETERLIAGGVTGELIVWDTADGNEIFRFPSFGPAIQAVDVSSDGNVGVVGDSAGNINVLALGPELLISTAENRATRELTSAECQAYLGVAECPDNG